MRHRSLATIVAGFVLFAIANPGGIGILKSEVALAQAVPVEELMPYYWGLSSHPQLLLDAQIETPARNNNVVSVPEKKAGDSIRFQLFVPDARGTQIQGYTVELSLRGKTFGSYVDDVSGTDLNGSALLSRVSGTGNPTLSMLSLSAVAVPANGYLGQVNLSVSRALTSSDVLAVSTASLAGPGGVQNLDVSVALLSFTQAAACPGDFDGDGTVGLPDFLALAGAFGSRSGDANYNALMDLDGSGAVDLSDFLAFAGVFGTTCEAPPPPRSEDREALVALYNATDGDNWRFNTNWLSDRPLGEWYGVTTDGAGRVTKLELYAFATSDGDTVAIGVDTGVRVGNRLAGTIPSEVGSLTNLGHLDLSANQLTGTIPSDLGSLTNLQVLGLWNNQLTGPIPSELGRLTDLQALGLENNQLTGEIAPELGRLTNLQYLNLHGNQLRGTIPSELGNLSSLEWLALSANPRLTGSLPGTFTGLANLDFLFLENTGLCAPTDAAFRAWLQGIESKSGVVNCDSGGGGGSSPDLVVDAASVSDASLATGESFTLRATVRNAGAGGSAATTLRYYRSSNTTISDSDTEVGTDAVRALDASGTSAESISLDAPSDAGTYYYGACVDAVSGESNTGNNCSSGVSVTVTAGGGGSGNNLGACAVGMVVKPNQRCSVGRAEFINVGGGCYQYTAFGTGRFCSAGFNLNGLQGTRSGSDYRITAVP